MWQNREIDIPPTGMFWTRKILFSYVLYAREPLLDRRLRIRHTTLFLLHNMGLLVHNHRVAYRNSELFGNQIAPTREKSKEARIMIREHGF